MKRRRFIGILFMAASATALKVRMGCRRIVYPGRIVPVDEKALKKTAKWTG